MVLINNPHHMGHNRLKTKEVNDVLNENSLTSFTYIRIEMYPKTNEIKKTIFIKKFQQELY